MAGPIDLSSVRPESNTSQSESQIFSILDAAINADQSPDTTATELDKLFPAGKGGEHAEAFLWPLWTLFYEIVKKVPASDERQKKLVEVVKALATKERETVTIWGADAAVWVGLPLLGPCTREAWNVIPKFDGSDKDAETIAAWISLNSFTARMLGASLQPFTNFAIWGLRSALEEPSSSEPNARDANLEVACEWFTHAGRVLHDKSREAEKLEDADARMLRTGEALEAQPGFSEQRWTFWREKLSEMSDETSDAALKERVHKVVGTMKGLEG